MIIQLFLYEKTCLPSDVYNYLLTCASGYGKSNALQKNTYQDKCTSLVNDFLLRKLIYKNYKFRYDEEEIIINNFGKPIFRNINYHFNFSHNDKYGVIVLSENPVGVDIENIEDINLKTKDVFLSDKELSNKYYTKQSLCNLWTAKESYCKAKGCGLNISLKKIGITKVRNDLIVNNGKKSNNWFVRNLFLPNKTMIAVCSNYHFLLKYNKVNLTKCLSGFIK